VVTKPPSCVRFSQGQTTFGTCSMESPPLPLLMRPCSLSESWRVWTGRVLAASPIQKRHGGTIIECREDGWHAPITQTHSRPNAALLRPASPASIPQVQTRREQAKAQQQQAAQARRTRMSVSVECWRPLGRNRVSYCSFSINQPHCRWTRGESAPLRRLPMR